MAWYSVKAQGQLYLPKRLQRLLGKCKEYAESAKRFGVMARNRTTLT
jgi:hypothetical protein